MRQIFTETFAGVAAGQIVSIEEGKGITGKQPFSAGKKCYSSLNAELLN